MLRELRIKNLAVIEQVTVPFAPGLNVLTGETGAGKSILLDALLLLSGVRPQVDLIRTDADAAPVEAVFGLEPRGPISAILEEVGLSAEDNQLIIRRELSRSGRHRAFINDSAATVGLLERLGDHLVEIHGQHEHQRLLEPARQLDLLDRVAGAEDTRARVARLVREWEHARAAVTELLETEREQAQKEDLYRFQLSEIDAARLMPGEEESLTAERKRLQHAGRLREGMHEVLGLLYDDTQSVTTRLTRATQLLGDLGKLFPELAGTLPPLKSAQIHVEEAVAQVRSLDDHVDLDPGHLEEIEARLDALAKLRRKYGEREETILAYRERIHEELLRIERRRELLAEEEARVARAASEVERDAVHLSGTRQKTASRLEQLIQRELRTVGLEKARFAIALSQEPASPNGLAIGPARWQVTARGVDRVEFRLSTNPGEELKPLARVISGGELSRTMLCLKAILAKADRIPTMVFDEVDAGIGGRVADQVGQKLAQTAKDRQVFCVTHLAQIAAYADQHLRVEKSVHGGKTRTKVVILDEPGRVDELARMLGGERVTETARRHARELYVSAKRLRSR